MAMKIREELLRITTVKKDEAGEHVEPEQQRVQQVTPMDFAASMRDGRAVGTLPGEIIRETTAGEMALAMRKPCFSCKHFDRAAWKKLYFKWNDPGSPMEMRNFLQNIRAHLLETQNVELVDKHQTQEGDLDVEHAILAMGVCRPLTEITNDVAIVYPRATCPPNVCSPDKPDGLYEPKHTEAERMGSAVYDRVMRTAQGFNVT